MERWLFAQHRTTGNGDRIGQLLRRQLPQLLQAATNVEPTEPAGDGSFLIELPGRYLGLDLHKRVRVTLGPAVARDAYLSIPLRWRAEPGAALFPEFDGHLEFESSGLFQGELTLVGRYTGPLGPVGPVGDMLATARVADQTGQRLLAALVDSLESACRRDDTTPRVTATTVMHVRDVMTPDPLMVAEDVPLRTAAQLMLHHGIGGLPVANAYGDLVGVVTERDLLDKEAVPRLGFSRAAAASDRRSRARTVGEASSRPVRTTAVGSTLRDAATEMTRHDVSRLVVLDGADVVGIVTRHDVLRALVRTDADLRQSVTAVLDDLQTAGAVEGTVEWGVVTLTGRRKLRSQVDAVIVAVERIDGVLGVDADVVWEVDDTMVPLGPIMPL